MGNKKMKIERLDSLLNDMQNERVSKKTITIKDFFELHEKFIQDKTLEGLAQRTLKEHKDHMRYFKTYLESVYQSDMNCVAISPELFKAYIYYMMEEKQYNPFTINIRLRTLKCYLKWLYNEKYLDSDIVIRIKLLKTPEDTIKPLGDEDIRKLLNTADKATYAGFRDFTLIILILDCGIRIHEAIELRIDDINLKNGIIRINAETTKVRKSRDIPISKQTCKLLKVLIDIAKENECENVFQSTYGGKIKKDNLTLSIARLGKKAGIKQKCTPYVLRHTFATNAVKNGIMDLFTLQRIMGHSSLVTTRKYIQLETQDLIKKHNKANPIDKYFKGGK